MIQLCIIQGFFKVTGNCREERKKLFSWHMIDQIGQERIQNRSTDKALELLSLSCRDPTWQHSSGVLQVWRLRGVHKINRDLPHYLQNQCSAITFPNFPPICFHLWTTSFSRVVKFRNSWLFLCSKRRQDSVRLMVIQCTLTFALILFCAASEQRRRSAEPQSAEHETINVSSAALRSVIRLQSND